MKKLLKKLSVMRLEERVLFDAAAAAAAAEAEQQAQQSEELQQQQQQLQEQLAEEAEQQAQQQAEQQAAAEAQQAAGAESGAETEAGGDGEAAAPQDAAAANGGESVNAGSEVSAAVEAIAADEGIEVEESTDVLENDTDGMVGENAAEVIAVDVEAEAEESSADLEAAAEAEADGKEEIVMTTEEVAAAIAEGTRHELVIVSSSVKDSKVIIDNLAEGTEVLVLEKGVDVLDQINEYLDSTAVKYDAIHVVSHGGDGYLVLNDSVIDMESLQADPASWAAIGEHVAEDGDIMLYGCNVAQTENGKAFANQLASLTGADIAASVDVTGGDYGWELEYVTNAIATPVLSFDGYNARLASLTLVEQDSPGTGAESRNWNIQLDTAGTYYGFATDTPLTNSDGTTVNSAVGQLYSVTVTEKAGEGGAPPTYEYKYTVESDTGNAQYVLDQAAASEGADSIAILKGNVDGSADLGNVSSAVNDGGLTISGASQIDITLSVSGTLNGSLSVETAQSVSVGGTVNLGAEGSLSISNITAATGNAVTTGAITGGEGASVSFSNISAATGNAVTTGAITGGEGVSVSFSNISAAGNAVNVGGAINVANAEFTDISADTGKAVNVTGSLSAETISFSGISTKTGSHAIHLNVLTVNGNGNAAFDDISGKVEVGTLDLVRSSVTITGSGTNPIAELTFGNVDLSEGASLAINGAVGDIQFGNVDISELSSFSIDAQLNGEELGETDVRFTGYVNVLLNSTFTVDIAGNEVRGDGFEANFAVNGNFTVSGGSTADINVEDIYGFTTDADYHLTRRHNWQTETGFNAATFNPFTWTGNNDSLVIFGGDVVVNRDQSDVHSSMTVDGAIMMYVGGDVTVGNTSGVTGSLEMTDFANLYINGNFTLNGAGEDGAPGSSATFRAIDRHPYEGFIGAYGELYRVELNGNATFVKGTTLTIDNVMFEVNTNNIAGRTFTHEGVINGSNSELVIRSGVILDGTGFEGGEVYLDSVRYENGLTALTRGLIYWGEYGNLGVYLADNAENYTINVDLFQSVTINNLTFINRDNDAVSFVGSNANVEMSGQFKDYQPTIDFEVGSKVNVIYNSTSQQYVLSGNYYELTVTNTAEKILAGSITVGVSAPQLKHLEGLYDRSYAQDLKILARKMDHLYRGGISLGTTLNTQGNTVDFYGYTYSVTPKAMIETGDSTAATNLVSYHVAQSLVNFGAAWGFLGLNANDHATGGVGFDENGDPLDGNLRDDQASRAFFGGTYQNLTIDTMPTLPVFSGVTLLPQDNITFNVDVDATVKGVFAVSTLKEGSDTNHHHLQVNVDSTMTFNNTAINLSDASLHFNGSVLGDISKITADRDNTFGNSGELQLIFESDLAKIGSISTDGIALTFNGDVERVKTIDALGWYDNAKYTKLTFNGDVEIAESIETHMEYDIHKAILTFNGETTGNAKVDSFRGEFYFNYDGDQEIFQGTYDDFHISGTGIKTVVDDVVVKGIFNGNETKITINEGVSFELSTLYQNAANDPHRPEFTVLSGATLQFGNANTLGMDFYGTIISSGNIEIFGKSNYYGTITLEDSGSMIVDKSADGSIFAEVINKGSGLKIERAITIAQLHNYGTMTISNNDVKLDVYNHNGANLVFDLKYGTAVGGAYSFDFDKGEGTVNWKAGEAYTNGAEVIDGNMYVANGNVPQNVRPGVEYWREISAFDNTPTKTYKIGDLVYSGDTVYRAVDSYVPGNSDLNNTDYWEVVGTAEAYAAGSAYNTGDIVSQGGNIYTAMTAVAAGTDPSVTYWTPVANTANRLINGGTITVNNGTLNLNNFTQGDKNAETGKWTYGHNEPIDEENFVFVYDEHFVVGQHGTLVFGATAAEVNTGNSDSPKMDSYLGTITNAGTVKVGDIGDIAFANDITNEGIKSKFILSNTGTTTFNGNFTHEGSLTTDAASNIVFGTNSVVSGSGTIGGVTGYNGTVDYSGSEQHIFTGIYNNDVTLATGIKTVAGEVIFNDSVNNAAVISGTAGSVQFEGDTTGAGSFAGSLDVSYDTDSATVYSGSYGDLVINSTDRTIAADLTAENLTLNGTNTFNGDLVVNGEILLGETSTTTFGEFSSLNADTDAAAVIKGGKNGGTLTFSTNALGENVTVYADGLNAAVTYNYNGADAQRILSGTYLSGMILGNSQKIISSEVAVTGELRAWASAPLVVENGGTLKVVGKIVAPALKVDFGAALSLTLEENSRLGTANDFVTTDDITGKITAASDTGVILGGKINLNSTNGSTLTVYGWQDVGALGEINVNGGIIKFAGTPDVYGYVNATLVNNTGSAGSVVDDGGRLNNIWVTIFNDAFTSELTGFANDSKFRVVNGATLTVDHFALWNDTNGNGSKDDGEEWIISNVVEAFSIQEGSTLIFDLTGGFYDLNAKTITVHDLNVENGGQVIVRESNTVTVDHYAEIEGTITGQGNVNMDAGTFSGYGTFDMTGGQVTYGSGVHVFSGNYNDLVLAANKLSGNIVVNGSAALDGIMTGNAKVTFNGETSGNATFGDIATDKTYTGAVTYGVAAQNIFGGQYSNIIIAGGAEDEHTVNSSLTVNVPDGGSFNLSSKLNLADGVQLTINGLTDAAAEGNTGSINALDNTSNVVYGYNAAIYGGTYANLTANGTEYTLAKNVTVYGTADLTGTFLGSVDVTFNGDTTGSALFGVIGDDTRIFGGTVAYNAASANVYGGNYRNLSVAGSGDHTINASLAVNTVANLSGKLTGTGDVTFAQGATLSGSALFGADGADYQGTVTYNGVADPIYSGYYTNLNFANGNTVSSAVSASGLVNLSGVLNVTETASVTFSGTTDANAGGNDGYINAANGSKFTYGADAAVYSGTYGDLTINGDHNLLSNYIEALGTNQGITVNGAALLNGTMTGNAKVTFNGETSGNATFGDIATDKTYTGAVTYGVAAQYIFGGQYSNIIIAGGAEDEHTVTSDLKINIPDGGTFNLSSVLNLEANVELTINGLTDANAEGNTGSINGDATSSVVYGYNAAIYGGTYGKLTANGTEYTLMKDLSVNGTADLNGTFLGSVNVTFNGNTTGSALFGIVGDENSIFGGTVTFGENASTVYGGNYYGLALLGSHVLSANLAVNNSANITGTLTGDVNVTFAQGTAITGGGAFGKAADDRYQGTVSYNGVTGVLNGFYSNLILANGNTTSGAIDVDNVQLSGVLTVNGTGSVNFAGTTDANAEGNTGSIAAEETTSITYADSADIYGGTYGALTFGGNRVLVHNMTVTGLATIDGTMTGSANVAFTGDTAGTALFGTDTDTYTGAVAFGANANVIYGGFYTTLAITGDHTLDRDITVVSGGTAALSGTMIGSANVTFNGSTAGDATFGKSETDAYTGKVTFNTEATAVYGGFYSDLVINGNKVLDLDLTVVSGGNAALSGNMTGTANVAFKGNTEGDATFGTDETAYAGSVYFGAEATEVYAGHYSNLTLDGAHTLTNNITVSGVGTVTGEQTLEGAVEIRFNGTTAGDGSFTDADDFVFSTVSYGAEAAVFTGSYGNLTITGAHTLTNDFSVAGTSNIDSVMSGSANVTFLEGAVTTGEGTFGAADAAYAGIVTYKAGVALYNGTYSQLVLDGERTVTDRTVTVTQSATFNGKQTLAGNTTLTLSGANGGTDAAIEAADTTTVIYNGAADQGVYTGSYGNLTIEGDHILADDFSVNNASTIDGIMSGTANVTFNGSTAGDATFGKSETDAYTGKVTFNTGATAVYGGFYSDLVINGNKVLDLDLTVVSGGNAALSGNMTGTANVAFKGNTEGDATFGTDETAFAGSVYFGSEATVVYGGHYNTLTIDGAHNLYDHITVDGVATVNDEQTLTGPVEINFYGTTSGNASFEDADDGMLSTVRYGANATVFGGSYGNLTITGAHTLTNDFSVAGTSTIDSVMSGSANVIFNKFAVTTGSGTFGAEGAAYAGVVTYEAGVALYNGTYSQLILEGERTITDRTVTVTQSATFNGKQTLEGNTTLTLSGTNDGLEAEIAGADTTTVIYNGAADQGVYTGSYGNLTIEGDHTLNNEIAVNKLATIEGVMSGSVNVTFKGETAGSGTFGTDAENRFAGVVTYSGGSNIFGGFYGGTENAAGLIIDNNGTIQSGVDVDAASVQLTGTLTVNGKILFSGYTDALAKGDNAQVAGNGTVGYVGTADIYGGEYNSLEIYGDRVFAADLTVRGTTTVYDNEDGSDARLTAKDDTVDLVFEGAVEGNGAYFGDGTNAFAGSVTYGSAEGEILTGIYNDLTVLSSNAVVGDMTVKGMLTLGDNIKLSGDGDWIIGATNAADAVATTTLNNTGKVTYNGLAAGETGWIFRGEYNDLTLEGGNYQVGTVTVDGTLTSDATGKIVFTDLALGEGKAENLNADYMYNANIYGGNYNNLGVNKIVAVANDVTVNGALTALSSSALITGSADFEVAGTLAGFDNDGRFEYEGEVIFSGAADYSVDGMAQGNIFNTLTMKGSGNLTLANSEFELLAGTGNINIGAGVTGGTVNMTAGKVTYTANADRYEDGGIYYSDIIDGTYYDLTLNQNDAVVNINGNVTVSNLFDINGHALINVGDLTIVKFDNEASLTNAGTLTFGGETAPDVRQVWGTVGKLDSIIHNLGTVIVNRANYTIENIYQYEDYGTITVAATAVADSAEKVVKLGVYSELNTVINLNANAELHDVDDSTTFTNRAVLNINDPTGGQFVKMHIYNLSQASINVRGGQYTFGDDVDLTNGGLVSVGEDTEVKFTDVSESVAGRPRYVNNGGTIDFSFTADSSNIKNGLLGDISNSNWGTINFNTKGVKFYGNISNSGNSYLYVNADTTFIGTVNNSHGLIQVGDGTVSVEAVFAESVRTGSLFQVMNQGRALFGSIVSVSHEFYLEKGSSALFMNEVRIFSDSDNDIDTIFHVKEGAEATFQGDVFNQNGYGFHERDGWANGVAYVTTPTDTRPIDSVIGSRDHSDSDTDKISKFIIDGNVVINGKLSNIAYAYGEANTDHQANVVINSNGNTFGAIDNRGRAARIDMNGSDNQLNGTIVNTGNLYLNGTNDYNDIVNSTSIASWSWTLNSKSAAAPGTVAKIFVNDGATGSTFQNVSNSNGATFTVVSYNATGIDLVFNGDVSNGQSAALINPAFFIINTPGSVFNGDVENYGNFLIHGAAQFNALFTNYATYQEDITMPDGKRYVGATLTVSADGTRFNRIDNRGVIGVDADTYFEGAVSNSATGTINLNVANLEFSQIDNSGHINLHNAKQTVIRNLNVGTSSVIDIDKESSLHLYVVTEEYTGNYDSKNYDYANDTKLGTFIVRGDKRNGVFEDHKEAFKSDTEHGLFFENTGASQSIASRILYDTTSIESSVWFDSSSTILRYDDATWIIIGNGESLTLDVVGSTEKYKVLTGGQLTVKEAASGTRIQVRGGTVLFDNDVRAMTITGLLEVMSGNAIFDNAAGITFSKTVYNAGTTTFNAGSVLNFSAGLNNTGTINAYTDLTSSITNKGNYVVMADGIRIDNKLGNENGTLTIAANAELLHDIKGTIAVQQGASLTIDDLTAIESNLANNGTVVINNASNYLAVKGDILLGSGTFTSANTASLVFAGNVAAGTSAVFNNILNVEYAGTSENGQNIINGVYQNLILTQGTAFKIIDQGTVTVNETFTNGSSVQITATGNLILNKAVAGDGAYTNAGTFNINAATAINGTVTNSGTLNANSDVAFQSTVTNSGTLNAASNANFGTLVNSGIANTNGTVGVADLQNSGAFNVNGTAFVAGSNNADGIITVNGGMVASGLDNAGTVQVNAAGTLALKDNGVLNGTVVNGGRVIAEADDAAFGANFHNTGLLDVNGDNASFAGNSNNGTITVNGAKADFKDAVNNGVVVFKNSDVLIDGFDNNGTIQIHAYDDLDLSQLDNKEGFIEFHVDATITEDITEGGISVGGGHTLTLNMDEVKGNYLVSDGTLVIEAQSADSVTIDADMNVNKGSLVVNNDAVFNKDVYISDLGTLQSKGDAAFNGVVNNNGTAQINGDALFSNPVVNAGTLQVNGSADFSNSVDNSGTFQFNSDAIFNNAVNNNGTINGSDNAAVTFKGATNGSGTVNGNAVYQAYGANIYGGNYNSLILLNGGNLNADANVGAMDLNGTLATGSGSSLVINGATSGSGVITAQGSVVYNGNGSVQSIYAGSYNDIAIGPDAVGNIDTNGDIIISGNAFDQSANAQIAVDSGKVTYNGTGEQHVMAGTYDELIMAGSGTKLMEAAVFNVDSFVSDGGSYGNMIALVSASAPEMWTLNANSTTINYSYIDNAASTHGIYLNGTNMTGNGNSGSWALFNGVGGVGDSFPSINNPNFQAIAPYMSDLHYGWAATDRFDIFRRMPVDRAPIAVGEMSELVVLNNFENYDMINFDGEFFGNDGIGLLDDEAREVLDDAVSAGASDLKALLED